MISTRRHLADLVFEGGDYHRAASQFHQLAQDLATRHSPDHEQVLHMRLQEATCHALTGETGAALAQLDQLLRDQRRVLGDDDERTLELRRQIGLLQLGSGQRQEAKSTLTSLLNDITASMDATMPSSMTSATSSPESRTPQGEGEPTGDRGT